jgi:STE24 endopeptidase
MSPSDSFERTHQLESAAEPAAADSVRLDSERQARARQYARMRRRLWLVEMFAVTGYLLLWIGTGWAARVREALPAHIPWWPTLLLIAVAVGLPWSLLSLPLHFYAGFVLPRRFGLSTQTLTGWVSDLVKAAAVSLILGLPLLIGLYALIRAHPARWWLAASAGYLLFTVLLSTLAPVVLLPLFSKIRPLPDEFDSLRVRLIELARQAGVKATDVFQIDMSRRTRAANAALAGLGRTRRILLGDTLLAEFSPDEIETVLAHELAHHAHRDIPFGLVLQTGMAVVSFYLVAEGLRSGAARLALQGPADATGLPLLALLLGLSGLLSAPLANAFSRRRERRADDFAIRATRLPLAFASALTRLANQNLAEAEPAGWIVFLFYSHPPLGERIARARAMACAYEGGAPASAVPPPDSLHPS